MKKKTILLVICAALLLCLTGCQKKEKKLEGNEYQKVMEMFAANNPYREKDSITQASFDPMDRAIILQEIVSVWNKEDRTFPVKDIYTTDQKNAYRFVITYEGTDYSLYITLNKDDATEFVMELPETQYKETYVLDRGLSLNELLDKLNGKPYKSPGEDFIATFDRDNQRMYIQSVNDSSPSTFIINDLVYIGIDNYTLSGTLYTTNGGQSDCQYSVKMTSYPKYINLKSDNPLLPVAGDLYPD